MENSGRDWEKILDFLARRFTGGERPGIDTVLFLIGVQELGMGPQKFSRDDKINLMHVGLCAALSLTPYCERTGTRPDGWPLFRQKKSLPEAGREQIVRDALIAYFRRQGVIDD